MDSVEHWKPLPQYEAKYEVSDHGRVRNIQRGTILRGWVRPDGYCGIELAGRPPRITRVHRLVLEAFVGPCPDGMEACHADGNRANNVLSNLRWDTAPNNIRDRIEHGTTPYTSTHCGNGHEYTDDTLRPAMKRGRPYRACRECERNSKRARKARISQAANA